MPADTTPPNINITKFGPTSARNITLNGKYQEEGTIANITIEVNSLYRVPAGIDTSSRTWNATINLTEGWNRFNVLAYDKAGNLANVSSSSQGTSILSDTTKPSINLTSPQNTSSVANNSLITFKISDLSLVNSFFTINSGSTKSFNSEHKIKVEASEWVNGADYVIVNATDSVNNVETKNFTFFYSNNYEVALNNSINVASTEINQMNGTANNLQSSEGLNLLINNSAAQISVAEYNKTLQTLNVVENISKGVSCIQESLQDILSINSSNQDTAAKTAAINAKLDKISICKNTTIVSVDITLFNSNLTVKVDNTTISNVTDALIAAVGGLLSADKNSFEQSSAILQNKTTIINSVTALTETFGSGIPQNITIFEKNITINETQSGQFYINEIIDKNITGNNDLRASTNIKNRVSQPLIIVVDDPNIRWEFSDSSSAVVSYSIDSGVPSDNVGLSQTVITTVPTSSTSGSSGSGGTSGGGAAGAGGGGGGGPPAVPVVTDFSMDKTSMKVILKQGETKKETLTIKNIGTTIFDVKAALEEIGKFKIEPAAEEIVTSLNPNEEKTIEFVFKASENEKPEIYPGKITLKSPSSKKEIALIVEVDSAQPLFDVDVEVLPDSKKVFPGQEVSLEVNLFNVRGFGRVDVGIEYSIKDLKGNVIATEHETLAVETQAKFARRILVPSYVEPGNYVAFAKVTYADSIGVSSDLFEVQAKAIRLSFVQLNDYGFFLIIGAVVLVSGILLFSAYKFVYLKKKLPQTKEAEVKQFRTEEKAQKLKKELEALEGAYKSGFISEESYQRDKKRIEEKLNSLK